MDVVSTMALDCPFSALEHAALHSIEKCDPRRSGQALTLVDQIVAVSRGCFLLAQAVCDLSIIVGNGNLA